MKIIERGILTSGIPGTTRATFTFPSVVALSDGDLLATCRVGSKKDIADETIEIFRSLDGGNNWSIGEKLFPDLKINGLKGSLMTCYLTEIDPGHLIAACMWIDRETFPGEPLFNTKTEGCLNMVIVLSDSYDGGRTWTSLLKISLPEDIGPPSLTGPLMKLKDGSLAMTIETNKHYLDKNKWYQRVVMFHSMDEGKTWKKPITVNEDKSGKMFYWDMRAGVDPDGRIATFSWNYDSETNKYYNILRRISSDNGKTWSENEDLGFADQASHPAILPDGRVVLAWVDRFGNHSIKVRIASAIDKGFNKSSELTLYTQKIAAAKTGNTGELLGDMKLWSFGLPYAEVLPDGNVILVYYAGTEKSLNVYWVKLKLTTA